MKQADMTILQVEIISMIDYHFISITYDYLIIDTVHWFCYCILSFDHHRLIMEIAHQWELCFLQRSTRFISSDIFRYNSVLQVSTERNCDTCGIEIKTWPIYQGDQDVLVVEGIGGSDYCLVTWADCLPLSGMILVICDIYRIH